jgi:hypothetical protein
MNKSTKNTLQRLTRNNDRRLAIVRYYLNKHGIRVKEWYPHYSANDNHPDPNKRCVTYWADFHNHAVCIPVPVDDYSFYLAMHEIGHIVKGDGYWSHKIEYTAEQWALAKRYVRYHIYNDVAFHGYPTKNISNRILKWLNLTPSKIAHSAAKYVRNIMHIEEEAPFITASLTL